MKVNWIGIVAVLLIASGIIAYKTHMSATRRESANLAVPRVLLVADLSEADAAGDACAEIIHLVRAARDRGLAVQELEPGSKSDLLTRFHVLTIPTVLILDKGGQVLSLFEGEGRETVAAIRTKLQESQ